MGKTHKDSKPFLGRRGAEYSIRERSRKGGVHENGALKREARNQEKALRQGDWE